MQALQVLEVREQLERSVSGSDLDLTTPDMDDGEKALLREMCNVSYLDIILRHRFSQNKTSIYVCAQSIK